MRADAITASDEAVQAKAEHVVASRILNASCVQKEIKRIQEKLSHTAAYAIFLYRVFVSARNWGCLSLTPPLVASLRFMTVDFAAERKNAWVKHTFIVVSKIQGLQGC